MKKMHTFTTPDGTTYEIADQYAREQIKELEVSSGESGATFTPAVAADGTLSWTNDKGLTNPDPVNVTGPQGPQGPQGPAGEKGESTIAYAFKVTVTGADGVYTADKTLAEIAGAWAANRPIYCDCTFSESNANGSNILLAPLMVGTGAAMFSSYVGSGVVIVMLLAENGLTNPAVVSFNYTETPTMNDIPSVPSTMPNPYRLTLNHNGQRVVYYNGAAAASFTIPTPYEYAQSKGYDGTEGEFVENLAKPQQTPDWNANSSMGGHILNRTHWKSGGELLPETALPSASGC